MRLDRVGEPGIEGDREGDGPARTRAAIHVVIGTEATSPIDPTSERMISIATISLVAMDPIV